jgi:hypothetical protein
MAVAAGVRPLAPHQENRAEKRMAGLICQDLPQAVAFELSLY